MGVRSRLFVFISAAALLCGLGFVVAEPSQAWSVQSLTLACSQVAAQPMFDDTEIALTVVEKTPTPAFGHNGDVVGVDLEVSLELSGEIKSLALSQGVTSVDISNLVMNLNASGGGSGAQINPDKTSFKYNIITSSPKLAFQGSVTIDDETTPTLLRVNNPVTLTIGTTFMGFPFTLDLSCVPRDDVVTVIPAAPITTWFHPMAPTRLIDPRPAWKVGPFSSPWGHGAVRDVQVAGAAGIPADAKAVVLNVTVTDVTSPIGTFISVYPKGGARPNVSSLNASPAQTIANSVTTKIGEDGRISVYNDQKTANVIIDVAGYYTEGSGDGYVALAPRRIIDSRPAWQVGDYSTPWRAGQTRDVTIDSLEAGVPADADAVALNVTATDVTKPSFITVYPKGGTVPNASNINLAPGNTIANQVIVKLGAANKISIYNEAGNLNVVVDVVGYYKAGSGDAFHPVDPLRIIDPRPAWKVGPLSTPWGNKMTRQIQVTNNAGVPPTAKGVVMNVTATDVISPIGTFVTVFPDGTVPNASNLNAAPGWTIANAVTAKLSTGGKVSVYNEKPTANIIVDVNGYFG